MDTDALPAQLLAWKFLRRNPEYRSNWKTHNNKKRLSPRNAHGFPIYKQTPDDLVAAKWGLLAFEPPDMPANDAHPFWAVGPTLDAVAVTNTDTPLLPMLHQSKARVSGLRLLDDSTLLFIRCYRTAVQLRLHGDVLSEKDWGISICLPVDLKLPIQLTSAQSLWDIVRGEPAKNLLPICSRASPSCLLPSTV